MDPGIETDGLCVRANSASRAIELLESAGVRYFAALDDIGADDDTD